MSEMKQNIPSYIIHYGIPNQKWGVRRFQNKDGSLTPEGKERYYDPVSKQHEKKRKRLDESIKKSGLDERISEKNRQILSSYSNSSQKSIMKYMKKHPEATFNQADRAETKKSVIKGLVGLGVGLGATLYFYNKMGKESNSIIDLSRDVSFANLASRDREKQICMSGKEYIDMYYYGRNKLGFQ